jgi:hypothetical protein
MVRLLLVASLLLLPACESLKPLWKGVDKICVKGRLSADQAMALNSWDWNKHNEDLGGAVEDDRVVSKVCSEVLRELEGRD